MDAVQDAKDLEGPVTLIRQESGNERFFDENIFWVVEMDQRGTGRSLPSVRQSWHNMKYYTNISIDMMAMDYELVREELNIDQWGLIWGGSFGSTVGLNYALRYPHRCQALIIRGIYLDTIPEVEQVYSRKTYMDNPKRVAEFDLLFEHDNIRIGRGIFDRKPG